MAGTKRGDVSPQSFLLQPTLPLPMSDKGPAFPTLRCPDCGNADLLFKPSGEIRCGRCMKLWNRSQLVRTTGTAGSSYDYGVKDDMEGD